jgi:DNA polymerase-3 subunit epsilon
MREIIFDTETTGRDASSDRIVEIGAVELINLSPTGRTLHLYVCPQCDVPDEVVRVHSLTTDFLRDKPVFGAVATQVVAFFQDSALIAHNADFDRAFLNAELTRCGLAPYESGRFIDTLEIARRRFRGASNSLDALAKRFQLDRYGFDLASRRGPGGHGALLDAKILAEVYLQLKGGREQRLALMDEPETADLDAIDAPPLIYTPRAPRPSPLPARLTAEEAATHAEYVETLGDKALWKVA